MDGRDVYGVTRRVPLRSALGEGTQLSRRRLVTYSSNVGLEGGVALTFLEVRALKVG